MDQAKAVHNTQTTATMPEQREKKAKKKSKGGEDADDDVAALCLVPGVGRKTASVVLNELGIEAAIAVDTHVFRVSHRLGLANAGTPDKVEAQLFRVVPEAWLPKAHHWLILHGRYTCTARKPKCGGCVISDLCPSRAGLAALGEAG